MIRNQSSNGGENERKEEEKEQDSDTSSTEEEEENEDKKEDIQDETQPMIGGIIFPYFRSLPIPDPAIDSPSEPILATCLVCKFHLISTINYPCCHACLCVGCARKYGRVQNICPVCRTGLESIDRVYLSYITYEEEKSEDGKKEGNEKELEPKRKRRKIK